MHFADLQSAGEVLPHTTTAVAMLETGGTVQDARALAMLARRETTAAADLARMKDAEIDGPFGRVPANDRCFDDKCHHDCQARCSGGVCCAEAGPLVSGASEVDSPPPSPAWTFPMYIVPMRKLLRMHGPPRAHQLLFR